MIFHVFMGFIIIRMKGEELKVGVNKKKSNKSQVIVLVIIVVVFAAFCNIRFYCWA